MSVTVSTVSPSICHEVMGPDAMIYVFSMLSSQPTFSLSSFTFIRRLFSSSLSAIRVVSSANLRLLIFLLVILIPVCASSSPAFLMQSTSWETLESKRQHNYKFLRINSQNHWIREPQGYKGLQKSSNTIFLCFNFLNFNWRIIALQCCADFCHTTRWINHKYTYVPSLLNLTPTPYIEHQIEHPVLHSNFPLAIYFTYGNVYVSVLLSQFILPSPSPH